MQSIQTLNFLKKIDSYISGEEISQSLNLSRAAIWKHMQELRQLGYEIIAFPHLGYKLVSVPDKLLPHEIQYGLGTKLLGKRIDYEETVSSTMDVAFKLAMEGASEGTVVCAETQTKGRGRLGRQWASAKGKGIYMSLILRPKFAPVEVAKLTLLCGVALTETIKKTAGLQVSIKWPNDLFVNGKKLAGILTELNAETDRVKFVIVGIGININTALAGLPSVGTSLKNETGHDHDRVKIFQEVLRGIEKWYLRLGEEGFLPVIKKCKELSLILNQRIRISDPAGSIEGEAIDIDQDGGLLIRQDSGVITKKMAGDVVRL